MIKLKNKSLLILASTFPRWKEDSVPGFVADFAESLAPSFHNIRVIAPHYIGAKTQETWDSGIFVRRFHYFWPSKFENIAYEGGAVGKIRLTSPIYLLKLGIFCLSAWGSALKASWRQKDTIINAHWLVPQGFIAILIKLMINRRVVITVHGGDAFSLNGRLMKKIKRFVLKRADAVVVNSSATLAVVSELYPAKDYHVIPMGIDSRKFTQKLRASHQPKDSRFKILFVGRLNKEKGIIYLCQAVKLFLEKYQDCDLTIIGTGPELTRLQSFIKANSLESHIVLAGWKQPDELGDYYASADVFVGPSIENSSGWREAFGLVFAEASANGLPVIATDVGGIKDIVKDGHTGFLVPHKNPQAICDKLQYYYTHREEAKQMGRFGAKFAKDNFSWPVISRKYLDVFAGLS